MSQHSGGRLARHHTPDTPGRPSLDRPSLFAGMDNEPSRFDGDTQRVRILSTLESTRRPARGPMKIHGITKKKRSNWQTKALVGLMAVGVASLLASFVMVLVNGHAASTRPDATQPAQPRQAADSNKPVAFSRVDPGNPLAALVVPPAARTVPLATPQPTQAAVIENVAVATPAAAIATTTVQAPAGAASSTASARMAKTEPSKAAAGTPAPHAGAQPRSPQVVATPELGKSPKVAAGNKHAPASSRTDEDVALLEAMFAHTRPRPAPESAADEIKHRCGGLSGPDAATCRARICVQNPTAAACHQD